MEECSECKKKFNPKTPVKCILCNLTFCCINCLLIHSENHPKKKEQLQTENLKINGKSRNLQNLTEIPSFITEGIFQEKNKFNQNYQMKYLITFPCLKEIGSGSFGKVYLMKNKLNNEICAIKIINKKEILELYGNYDILYNEISIHSRLIHKNIIRLYNVYEDKNHIKMIMEYALNGNLFNKIRQSKIGFSEKKAFKYFIQILNAVYFLHKNNIIHRDIKPENILIDKNDNLKLCDFGWSKEINIEKRTTFCGTVEYMAPEIIDNENYDFSVDIWSLGILLYEMLFGYSPFRANNIKGVVLNIKEHHLFFDNKKIISNDCKDLIQKLLISNPEKRLKIKDIFSHKFVLNNLEDEIYDFDVIVENELRDSDIQKIQNINKDNNCKLRKMILSGGKIEENKIKYNKNKLNCKNEFNENIVDENNNNKELKHYFSDLIKITPFSEQKENKKENVDKNWIFSMNEILSIEKDESIIPENNKKENILVKQFNLFDNKLKKKINNKNEKLNTERNKEKQLTNNKSIISYKTKNLNSNEDKENKNNLNNSKIKKYIKTGEKYKIKLKPVIKDEEPSFITSLINTFLNV